VSSKPCGPFFIYQNDGTDIQYIYNRLNIWQNDPHSVYELNFESAFHSLGEGTLITNTPFSIYMASAYPLAYTMNSNPTKDMYKFIFIITNQKTQ
jgi:hypothetical protein